MKPLTGFKVLLIALSAFGVLISVNVVLAVQAVRTFPGLEVANSYIASQSFDADRAAQMALGWHLGARYDGGELRIGFTDADGRAVRVVGLDATLGRATHVRDDVRPAFVYAAGEYAAQVTLDPGNWNIRVSALSGDGTPFRQRVVLRVRD